LKLEAGQVAVVTGAASGLGRALAEEFAARGLVVVLADVEEGPLAESVAAIEATGATVVGVPTDVRFSAQVDALAAITLERFGRVDVVVNNAGIMPGIGPMWIFEEADWDWVLSVNLRGVVHGIRAFVPHLVTQGRGHVVNTASMAGLSVSPGLGPYMVSKHGVVAVSEGLAADLALAGVDVGVTVVCPGGMTTNIVTAERNRPADLQVAPRELDPKSVEALVEWMSITSGPDIPPQDAALIVVQAIENDVLHVAPNGTRAGAQSRIDRLLADIDAGTAIPRNPG
jgi:NAD(P)-dependent dehydrogenase (short-subunit alcohol dehydrogenase family)